MLLPKLRTAKDPRRAWPGWGLIHSGNQRVPACPAVAPLDGSRNGAGVVRIQRTLVHRSHDPIRPNMPAHNRRHYVRFAISGRGVTKVPSGCPAKNVTETGLPVLRALRHKALDLVVNRSRGQRRVIPPRAYWGSTLVGPPDCPSRCDVQSGSIPSSARIRDRSRV